MQSIFSTLSSLCLCVGVVSASAQDTKLPAAEKKKIEALIAHVEGLKDAKFVRGNKEYDAKTAGKFLRGKWEANAADVKSARDFIDKVASVSGASSKPYLIRFKDKKDVKSGDYLLEQLKKLEKSDKDKG